MNTLLQFIFATLALLTFNLMAVEQRCSTEALASLIVDGKRGFYVEGDVVDSTKRIELITRIFDKVDDIITGGLIVPANTKVKIVQESQHAVFKQGEEKFVLPVNLKGKSNLVSEEFYEVMLHHEYGHEVFHENLKATNPLYHKNVQILQKYRDLSQRKRELQNKEATAEELLAVGMEIDKLRPSIPKAEIDKLFTGAYHELYADLVTVVTTGDLNAMKKLILNSDTADLEEANARSFEFQTPLEGWDYETPHFVFAPTRSYLGSKIKQGVEDKAAFLKKAYDVISKQFEQTRQHFLRQYETNPDLALWEYDYGVEQLNRTLIEELEKAL